MTMFARARQPLPDDHGHLIRRVNTILEAVLFARQFQADIAGLDLGHRRIVLLPEAQT